MSSGNGGHGLPSIDTSDHPGTSNARTRQMPSMHMPRRSNSPERVTATSQPMPRGQRNPRSRQLSQQSALGASSSEQHVSPHHRTSRSLSTGVEDVDWSRNWNSEGGRPKRERTLSERTNSRRLLHRSSINSAGELVPFQRAPRDGSYESHLPLGKRATSKKLTRQDSNKDLLNLDQRQAAHLQESPESDKRQSNVLVEENAGKGQSLAFEGQRRRSVKAKVTSTSSDSRRDGSSFTRKQSTQESDKSVRKDPPEVKPRGCTQSNVTSQGVTALPVNKERPLSSKNIEETGCISTRALNNGLEKNTALSSNVTSTVLEQNSRLNLQPQRSESGSNSQSANFNQGPSSEPSIDNIFNEDDLTSVQNVRTTSPSPEFKVAAQPEGSISNVQPSITSTNPTSRSNSTTRHTVTSEDLDNQSNPPAPCNNEPDVRTHEQPNASQQANSVIRRRVNLTGTVDTSQIQPDQVAPSSLASTSLGQRTDRTLPHSEHPSGTPRAPQDNTADSPESLSQSGSAIWLQTSPRDSVTSVSPRTNTAQPPSSESTSTSASVGSNTTSRQARLNRFGRRIRMPSSDSAVAGESDQPTGEFSHAPEPASEERFEGTNRQRYRFFTLSRDRSETDNEVRIPMLTPNRDLLYGPSSPPLLRRHHRTHFGSGVSSLGQPSEEQGTSASIHSSLASSISDSDLGLGEDAFRTASGSTGVFSPVLQSGPVLNSSSSSTTPQRRRLPETGPPSSRAIDSTFSSNDSSSPRQLHLRSFMQSHYTGGVADIDRSSDYDQDNLTFSVEDGRLSRDARRRYQSDRSEAIPRLLPQRSRQPSRELSRGDEIMEDVFGSAQGLSFQRSPEESTLRESSVESHIPLLGSPLFAPLGIAPGMLLSLLIRTRREFGEEFMELLLENMMLNVLAHHLFETNRDANEDGINGAPPPATQEIIDNLKEIPALETHIEKELKCAICHSEYELYEMLTELPCLHFFHPTCVAIWLKKSGTCPVCRFQLPSPTM